MASHWRFLQLVETTSVAPSASPSSAATALLVVELFAVQLGNLLLDLLCFDPPQSLLFAPARALVARLRIFEKPPAPELPLQRGARRRTATPAAPDPARSRLLRQAPWPEVVDPGTGDEENPAVDALARLADSLVAALDRQRPSTGPPAAQVDPVADAVSWGVSGRNVDDAGSDISNPTAPRNGAMAAREQLVASVAQNPVFTHRMVAQRMLTATPPLLADGNATDWMPGSGGHADFPSPVDYLVRTGGFGNLGNLEGDSLGRTSWLASRILGSLWAGLASGPDGAPSRSSRESVALERAADQTALLVVCLDQLRVGRNQSWTLPHLVNMFPEPPAAIWTQA